MKRLYTDRLSLAKLLGSALLSKRVLGAGAALHGDFTFTGHKRQTWRDESRGKADTSEELSYPTVEIIYPRIIASLGLICLKFIYPYIEDSSRTLLFWT